METDMKEKMSGIITIQGEGTSVEVVKQLVRFLYTDQTDKRNERLYPLRRRRRETALP